MRLTSTLFALALTVSAISQAQIKTFQQDKSQTPTDARLTALPCDLW